MTERSDTVGAPDLVDAWLDHLSWKDKHPDLATWANSRYQAIAQALGVASMESVIASLQPDLLDTMKKAHQQLNSLDRLFPFYLEGVPTGTFGEIYRSHRGPIAQVEQQYRTQLLALMGAIISAALGGRTATQDDVKAAGFDVLANPRPDIDEYW